MDTHDFTPSRPQGTVCVVERRYDRETNHAEVCGYPAAHPIHDVPTDVPVPAEGSRERTMERRFLLRQRLQDLVTMGKMGTHDRAAAEIEKILDEVLRIPTPAEAVTGVSDRAHAALTVVAELRQRALTSTGIERRRRIAQLDLIEAALREPRATPTAGATPGEVQVALSGVAELRGMIKARNITYDHYGPAVAQLDRIETALRGGE